MVFLAGEHLSGSGYPEGSFQKISTSVVTLLWPQDQQPALLPCQAAGNLLYRLTSKDIQSKFIQYPTSEAAEFPEAVIALA